MSIDSSCNHTMTEHTITFYLVRHGEAENNLRFVLNSAGAKKEYPLTEKGREQAKEAAKKLHAVEADELFSSPILRAKQTAEIISGVTGLPIVFDNRLWEAGMGVFNDQSQKTLLKKYPRPEMRLAPDPQDQMESFLNVYSRLETFLDELKEKYSGKKIILVSHGDPLEQMHGLLNCEGPGRAALGWTPKHCEVKEVNYTYTIESRV